MPKHEIELLAPAWFDLEAIAEYHLLVVGPRSARKITDKILNDLKRLESFPLSCPSVPYKELAEHGYRMLICGKYVCIYRFIGDIVLIYHIVAAASNYPALFK